MKRALFEKKHINSDSESMTITHTEAEVRAALDKVVDDFNVRFPSDRHTYKISKSERDSENWEILMYGASSNAGDNFAQFRHALDAVHRSMPTIRKISEAGT